MNYDNNEEILNALRFLHLSERLKFVLRHGWTSTGRQESVADHSWRLSLMILLFHSRLGEDINLEKALHMAVIHDLCEVITGDIPFFEAIEGTVEKQKKHALEENAMEYIRKFLNNDAGEKIYITWNEYQEGSSKEAKFVHALDKIEAQIQQNEADISTWNEFEKESIFTYLDKFCDYDDYIREIKEAVRNESVEMLRKSRLTSKDHPSKDCAEANPTHTTENFHI